MKCRNQSDGMGSHARLAKKSHLIMLTKNLSSFSVLEDSFGSEAKHFEPGDMCEALGFVFYTREMMHLQHFCEADDAVSCTTDFSLLSCHM